MDNKLIKENISPPGGCGWHIFEHLHLQIEEKSGNLIS